MARFPVDAPKRRVLGLGADLRSAVTEAVAHWTLGVLPVLAQWRGQHSCLSGSRQLETRRGQFTLLAGPTIMRGRSEGDMPPAESSDAFWQLLEPVLRARPLTQRVQWLELFASKAGDGSVEATCRLNNRDWNAGRRLLENVASAWEIPQEPLRSCRQFAMLVPKEGNTEEIIVPSFWDRVLSRA